MFALVACDDGDSYSSFTDNLLTITVDSVKMDTVFSRVPVPTQSFWIFNNSSDGIRCSNVRLERGNQSGFRVNVDGIYLGDQSGYQTSDIEVRKGDSIRVFVELTTPDNGSALYKKVEDNLIFTLESGRQQVVSLNAVSWNADKVTNLEINSDSIIDTSISGKALVVYGGITVNPDAKLTIAPGSTIYFHDDAGINVKGQLISKGTADRNVTLRCDRLDRMFDYLTYDSVPGRWQGIHFDKDSYDNEIEYTDIHGGTNGVVCDSSDISRQKLTMTSSTINNCNGYGMQIADSKVDVTNCQISNSQYECVYIDGGDVTMLNNTIAQFYVLSGGSGNALFFGNSTYPLQNLDVRNCIVTGYIDDAINADINDSTACNYQFSYCQLRTPEVKDAPYVDHFANITWEDVEDTITCGRKNFMKVDYDLLQYDFHLSEVSKANGAGNPEWLPELNRDGLVRDKEKANMGCY